MSPRLYQHEEVESGIDALLTRIRRSDGGVLVLRGATGMGKTTALATARHVAQSTGFTVLTARGAMMEQQFPFGLVHQLFPSARASLPSADPGQMYAVLQALYWDLVETADRAPVVLLVDDAQWADEASVRFLQFLHGRLDGVPIGLVVGSRAAMPQLPASPLSARTQVLELQNLGSAAVTQWLTDAHGINPSARFTQQIVAATGGNPFLLEELTRQMVAESMLPDDEHAHRVASLSPTGVTMSVLLRLSGATPAAAALAHWLAVLESVDTHQLAAVTGSTQEQTDVATSELVHAGVVQAGEPIRFIHPLIATAVYAQLSVADRAARHAIAARALHESAADSDLVAAHVLKATPPTSWAVPLLRSAARQAQAAGSPEAAAKYLRRAVEDHRTEPAADVELAQLLLEWGTATAAVDLIAAQHVLQQAMNATKDGAFRIKIQVELSRAQRFSGQAAAATAMLLQVRQTSDIDDETKAKLDAELFACASVSTSARRRLADWRAEALDINEHRSRADRSRMVAATAALDAALDSQPLATVQLHSTSALDGLHNAEPPALAGNILSLVGLAALVTDQLDQASTIFDALIERTNATNLADRHADMLAQRASLYLRRGDLIAAAAEAQRALNLAGDARAGRTLLPRAAAVIVAVAAERGDEPPLMMLTDDIDPDSIAFRLLSYSRAELLAARGQHASSAAAFAAYGQVNLELGWSGVASPWRSQLAMSRIAAQNGSSTSADVDLVEQELELAVRAGVARAVGVATRVRALLRTGSQRVELLMEAATWLNPAVASVELGWTLVDLGREHLRAGRLVDARTQLGAAHQLAGRSGATRLAARAARDLTASGGRPRATRRIGVDALTPAEKVTSTKAAAGLSNRTIARELFVTEKTVEAHLRSAFRKLAITGRAQLTAALQPPGPAGSETEK